LALTLGGPLDESIAHSERAIRLSPHDPQNAVFNVHLAAAHYHMGRYAEAANFGRKAIQQRFGLLNGHRIYTASLAQAGQIEEAREELAILQELHPENSIAWVEQNIPLNPGRMAKLVEGLRKAGMQ
jgi:tetratricopeptide (TPR) repeat protein